MTNEPRDAFTCRSSTLAVLADSGPFLGLLVTVLSSEAISIVIEPQGVLTCRSSTLAVLADSGPFHGPWGPSVISMINEPWGAFTCRSSTLAVLADSCLIYGLLLPILGSRSDFHD